MSGPLRLPLLATLVVALLVSVWLVWAELRSAQMLSGLPPGAPTDRFSIGITLPFEPESFHILRAQEIGQLVGVDGRTMMILDAPRAEIARFARNFWVAGIALWNREPA